MQKVKVDWEKIINKSIIDKVEHVFSALGWTMEEIKPAKVKKEMKKGIFDKKLEKK
jgi:DNA polymerase elongation subunit (family B)